ncbi:MAG: VOC family protein [Pseudomonadota bacterium]
MKETSFRDDGLTLEITCIVDAPRTMVWRCWTEAELFRQWFCPKPWMVTEADFKLQPGGRMNTIMQGPDGTRVENSGVWLEIEQGRRLTFTDAYSEGFIPNASSFITSYVELSDRPGQQTEMVWGARHSNDTDKQKHLAMGFQQGWSAATGQLEDLAQSLGKDINVALIEFKSKTRTCLWFDKGGQKAAEFYVSLLPGSSIDNVLPHGQPDDPMIVEFTLAGAPMMILTAGPHYKLSPAASIAVLARDQSENDKLWAQLLADGGQEGRCGWLTDRFGVSWQIVPEALPRLLAHPDANAADRVKAAMMQMKKIDIITLETVFAEEGGA